MKVSAIISEYNPFHKGHQYHLNTTKEITNSDAIICIMSGNYVQRGMPAIIDKWKRTEAALLSGVDLVIELPVIYSLSSAEFFSYGAVSLANSLGIVDSISFGSEIGDIDFIKNIASILANETSEFKVLLKSYLDRGYTYPLSRSNALKDYITEHTNYNCSYIKSLLNSSNNILGIEYCKSLLRLNSSINPITVTRLGGSYNSSNLDKIFSSATSIRKSIKEKNNIILLKEHLPENSFELIRRLTESKYQFAYEEFMLPYIRYKYFTDKESLKRLPDVSEGLENRIYKALNSSTNYADLVESIKSKRYTHTRITRILCQYFVGFDGYSTEILRSIPCPYARILGFNNMGKKILKQMKSCSTIPVYTKIPKNADTTLQLDIQATKSYSLLNSDIDPYSDYLISPIIIEQ